MKAINIAKYEQNIEARKALKGTGSKKIGEVTMHPFFGTSQTLNSKFVLDFTKWKGKNQMGHILEEIRATLQ